MTQEPRTREAGLRALLDDVRRGEIGEIERALVARGYTQDADTMCWRRELTVELELWATDGGGGPATSWDEITLSLHPICGEAVWSTDKVGCASDIDTRTLEALAWLKREGA